MNVWLMLGTMVVLLLIWKIGDFVFGYLFSKGATAIEAGVEKFSDAMERSEVEDIKAKTHAVGERAEVAGLEWVVEGFEEGQARIEATDTELDLPALETSGRFVIVRFKLTNRRKESVEYFTSWAPKLRDSEGRTFERYEPDLPLDEYLPDTLPLFTKIQPGLHRRWAELFEVPEDSSGLVVILEAEGSLRDKLVPLKGGSPVTSVKRKGKKVKVVR